MRISNVCAVVLAAGLAVSSVAHADVAVFGEPRPGVLSLRTGDVAWTALPNALTAPAFAAGWHVLALDGPLTPERELALRQAGVRLGDYLPTDAFLADVSAATPARVAGLGFVRWAGPFQNAWKLDPELGRDDFQTLERQALTAMGRAALVVHLFPGAAVDPALAEIAATPGAEIVGVDWEDGHTAVRLTLDPADAWMLAESPAVQMVENASEITLRSNANTRWIVQTNATGQTPLYTAGITGQGQVVGVIDGQISVSHCAFVDSVNPIGPNHRKLVAYNVTPAYDFHGTHVAGTAAGRDLNNPNGNNVGIAYNARIAFHVIPAFTESAMTNQLNTLRNQGARVITNSWGDDGTVAYNGLVRAIDNFSWLNDDSLVLFAVTNTSSLRNPENAKNCLAVMGTGASGSQQNFCTGGTGPTNDGRRKPEIGAPGCSTVSSSGTACATASASGTSMATPAVAGTAALVRQYFADGFYPTGVATPSNALDPSGALVKAVLLNSGTDMTGLAGYPGTTEGWGRVTIANSLFLSGDADRLIVRDVRNRTPNGLATGESRAMLFRVNGPAPRLRVTLVWHEPPASLNANPATINNLDLSLTRPDEVTLLGNVFSGGFSTTGGTADTRNNVEQIHIAAPTAGVYRVNINAPSVQSGSNRQGYALVVTGDVAPCPADRTQDGTVDLADFFDFFNCFDNESPCAETDGQPGIDLGDFFAFLNGYDAGC